MSDNDKPATGDVEPSQPDTDPAAAAADPEPDAAALTKADDAAKKCADDKAGSTTASCKQKVRIYFAFYYLYDYKTPDIRQRSRQWTQDFAFKRAAETWLNARKEKFKDTDEIKYEFMLEPVTNEATFKAKWQKVNEESWKPEHVVVQGALFVHASHDFETQSGLELYGDNQAAKGDGTLSQAEIDSLPRLNWEPGGKLEVRACNSAFSRVTDEAKAKGTTESWVPAQAFANRQRVTTEGEGETAQFSGSADQYERIGSDTKDVYLGSYNRSWHGLFGDGKAIPGTVFTPADDPPP